jgi:hypothetical protein
MVVQTVAEDVLLHSVTITSLEQLQNFELRLRKPTLPYRSPVTSSGSMVRSLDIDGFVDEIPWDTPTVEADKLAELMDWVDSVTSVIGVLPLLRHFALHGLYATRSHIMCLRLATQGQLTSLDIKLCFDWNLSSGVLQSMNSLARLERLKITIEDSRYVDYEIFPSSEAALIIPTVITFDLTSDNFDGPYYAWIGCCRFNVSCSILLNIFEPWDADDTPLLFPFFDAHQSRSVNLRTADSVVAALASRLVKVDRLALILDNAPYALLTSAGRMPKHLTVNACTHDRQISEKFWEFLQLIPSQVSGGHTATTLSVNIDGDGYKRAGRPFLWSDGATKKYRAFIGRLLTEAARLYKEGVIIQDGDGRDIELISLFLLFRRCVILALRGSVLWHVIVARFALFLFAPSVHKATSAALARNLPSAP